MITWRRAAAIGLIGAVAAFALGAQLAPGWRPGSEVPLPDDAEPAPTTRPCADGAPTVSDLPVPSGVARLTTAPNPMTPTTVLVLVPGAGPSSRDDLAPAADALARCGIHVVTYDKPVPPLPWQRDFAVGAEAAGEALLAARTATRSERAGAVGWSEGGWVVARMLDGLDVAILAGAPVVTPTEQAAWLADSRLAGAPDALRRLPAAALSRFPLGWTDEDSRPFLIGSTTPLLGVWGQHDTVVPVADAIARLRTAMPAASVLVLGGGDHQLTGSAWPQHVAGWLSQPTPHLVHAEADPDARHGVPALPGPTWATHPLTHLAVALTLGAASTLIPRRNP